jgi:hypothetical protein
VSDAESWSSPTTVDRGVELSGAPGMIASSDLDRSEVSTMTEPMKQRWEELGLRFEALGRVVKQRYQSAETAPSAERDDACEERAALHEALDKIVTAAQELGERAASIVHDPAVNEQTTLVARSLNEVQTASVDQIGDEVGKLLRRAKGAGSSESHDDQEPPTGGTTRS